MTLLSSQKFQLYSNPEVLNGAYYYQKQMSGLPALLGDLHERALFDKHLQDTEHVERNHHYVSV